MDIDDRLGDCRICSTLAHPNCWHSPSCPELLENLLYYIDTLALSCAKDHNDIWLGINKDQAIRILLTYHPIAHPIWANVAKWKDVEPGTECTHQRIQYILSDKLTLSSMFVLATTPHNKRVFVYFNSPLVGPTLSTRSTSPIPCSPTGFGPC